MATTGKLPIRGFKAGAIKYVTLRGYTPSTAPTGILVRRPMFVKAGSRRPSQL